MSISVALCTHNGARFLKDQLASIAKQDRLPEELVICDDCSTDGTVALIERFASDAPFPVRFFANATQLGLAPEGVEFVPYHRPNSVQSR